VPTWGFVYQEHPPPRQLLKHKLEAFRIPNGSLRAKLKAGQSVINPFGEEVCPEQVLAEPIPGRKIVVLGDTCDASNIVPLAKDCLVAIHECTFSDDMIDKAKKVKHATPSIAADFAKKTNAENLILTHFSSRYDTEVKPLQFLYFSLPCLQKLCCQDVSELKNAVSKIYKGPVLCAHDFWSLVIKRRARIKEEEF
jgi:ribonuclease Z